MNTAMVHLKPVILEAFKLPKNKARAASHGCIPMPRARKKILGSPVIKFDRFHAGLRRG